MTSSTRRLIATLALLVYLPVYIAIAAMIGDWVNGVAWAAPIFYAAAGILWILPLKPLFAWTSRGRS